MCDICPFSQCHAMQIHVNSSEMILSEHPVNLTDEPCSHCSRATLLHTRVPESSGKFHNRIRLQSGFQSK